MQTFVTKLKFTDKAEFDTWKNSEAENTAIMTVVEIGTITIAATFDNEGNELTPAETIEGYHVDVMSTGIIQSLKNYTIIPPDNPVHGKVWQEGSILVTPEMYD